MLINWGLIMNNLICIQVHVYIQIAKSRVLFFKGLSSSDVLKGDLFIYILRARLVLMTNFASEILSSFYQTLK